MTKSRPRVPNRNKILSLISDPFPTTDFPPSKVKVGSNNNNNNNYNGRIEISTKVDNNNSFNSKLNKNNNINNAKSKATIEPPAATAAAANFANFEFVTNETDFFAAFNDNFNKQKDTVDTVDAFGGKSTPISSDFKHTTTLIKSNNAKINNNSVPAATVKHAFNDDFDNAFGALNVNNNSKSDTQFGFDDGFSDFGKFDAFAEKPAPSLHKRSAIKLKKNNENGGSSMGAIALDKGNNNEAPPKVADRYAGDYSKTDQFEDDLQTALQRSLVDQ